MQASLAKEDEFTGEFKSIFGNADVILREGGPTLPPPPPEANQKLEQREKENAELEKQRKEDETYR